ncbi:MAG: RluA family pseudouridine synthase [Planctomycetota bacterium]|nr:MAG: RluA family pseudouridine synthase [Planctomycetota bacterium]
MAVEYLKYADSKKIRIDSYLAQTFPEFSRSFFGRLIKEGEVLVNGKQVKPSYLLSGEEEIEIHFPPPPPKKPLAEDIPLEVLFENEHILVINKPAGLVVHPGPGNAEGTLVNGLLNLTSKLSEVDIPERAGIVHRLDKDTSGVILVAKTNQAHFHLAQQFQERSVQKEYLAITHGVPKEREGRIDLPIGRSQRVWKKMKIDPRGKASLTYYKVQKTWGPFAFIIARPKTGRTHQIRLHLRAVGAPILCDELYGKEKELKYSFFTSFQKGTLLSRQALHAHKIKFQLFGKEMEFQSPLPEDLQRVLDFFQAHYPKESGISGKNDYN